MDTFELIDSLSLYFTIGASINIYAEVGYDGTVTDTKGPRTIEVEAPAGAYTVIDDFVVPDSLPEGSDITVSVLLRNAGDAAGYLWVGIDGNYTAPDRYMMIVAGNTPTMQPGASVWLEIPFGGAKMPAWNFHLTVYNEEGTSQISRKITLGALIPPNLKIGNLTYPHAPNPGDTVNINWGITNQGGNTLYPQWTRLIDEDTLEQLHIENFVLDAGGYKETFTTWIMPDKTWNLRIEAGYNGTLTASKTIRMNGVPPIIPLLAVALIGYVVFRK